MVAAFDILPPELVLMIIEEFEESQEILSFMMCCRRLHAIAERFLYKTIKLQEIVSRAGMLSLLQTILQRPILATYTKTLELTLWEYPNALSNMLHSPRRVTSRPILNSQYKLVEQKVKFVSKSREDEWKWLDDIRLGQVDAFLGLILISMPNLERLYITHYPQKSSYFFEMIRRVADREPPFDVSPTLTRLSYVHFSPFSMGRVRIGFLSRFLQLPAIEALTTLGIDEEVSDISVRVSSHIKNFEIINSSCTQSIGPLLEGCKKLRSFKYTHGNYFHSRPVHINLWESLRATRHTLESLWLDWDALSDTPEHLWPLFPMSFDHFPMLKILTLPAPQIFGRRQTYLHPLAAILPKTLETLCIMKIRIDAIESIIPELLHIVISSATIVPCLKRIKLSGIVGPAYESRAYWAEMRVKNIFFPKMIRQLEIMKGPCQEAGVILEFSMPEWKSAARLV
ncbi:hypothetical protein LOZ36_000947 [Ophidiomyces ophidiicola]|nr:hypothetical protein LOZ36_000947 [Ophidiomyces ophidiicola]